MAKFKTLLLLALPLSIMAGDLKDIVKNVQSNELVESLGYFIKSQEHGRGAIVSHSLPKIKASYMYQQINEEQRGLFDPETSAALEASMLLFDGFKSMESYLAQSSRIDSTKESLELKKEQLALESINLYFNIKTIQANIDARMQKEKQFQNDLKRLERFYSARIITKDKVDQVRAALAMTQYEINYLQQNAQELKFSLESLSGVGIDKLGDASLIDNTVEQNGQNHELLSLKHEIDALEHDAKVKTAEYWPNVVIKDTFTTNKFYESSASIGYAPPEATNKIQLAVSITLWDTFAKSKERQIINMQKEAKRSELAFKQRDNDLKKRFALIKLETIKSKISSSQIALEASEESFEYISKQHEANLVDTSIYLDSAAKLYDSKSILEGAKNEYQMALANYYFYNTIPLLEMIK